MSSGERKRRRLNRVCVIADRRCASGVVGRCVPSLLRGRGVIKLVCSRRVWEGLA